MDGAGSYSVAHRAGLLPTELTGMRGWILLRFPPQGRGSAPPPTPTKQRPGPGGSGVRATEEDSLSPCRKPPEGGPSPQASSS